MEKTVPSGMKFLNLGCGGRYHPDWVNVDFYSTGPGVMAHNLTTGLPFGDNSFDALYHSHLLEHFSKDYAPEFLKECCRVVKPGGIIRVAVPDLECIARLYLDLLEEAVQGDEEARKKYEWIMIEMLDQTVRNRPGGEMLKYWRQNPMPAEDFVIERVGGEVRGVLKELRSVPAPDKGSAGKKTKHSAEVPDPAEVGRFRLSGEVHQWMYDRYSLSILLEGAGFTEPRVAGADDSAIPGFNSYLLDLEPDGSVRKPDSLFMEATKPDSPLSGNGGVIGRVSRLLSKAGAIIKKS